MRAEGDATLGEWAWPAGESKDDPYFGRLEVFHQGVMVTAPLRRSSEAAGAFTLTARYQGCAERGVCYPPIVKTLSFTLPAAGGTTAPPPRASLGPAPVEPPIPAHPAFPEQDRIGTLLASGNLPLILAGMFGAGVLLAFTACMYPMIPILSGVIVGQGQKVTTLRALWLSVVYVEAVAITYAGIGIATAALGAGVQAYFQHPVVIVSFALVFVALAFSMFGFFHIQMSGHLQARLHEFSRRHEGGTLAGVAMLGMLSALIVGPCAGPVLFGALAFISSSGDYGLGGLSLFALGNGMGAPLLVFGVTGGSLLPRAGAWMNTVKTVFGVVLLGVAVLLMERVVPGPFALVLWALLLIVPAIYMGALEPVAIEASGWRRLWKGMGLGMLFYGAILLVGAASGGNDVFRPLAMLTPQGPVTAMVADAPMQPQGFISIKSGADLNEELDRAMAAKRPVLLDFYADWCTYCVDYERQVFPDAGVRAALANTVLLRADVTKNDADDRALLNRFGLFAPPAILFFGADGVERKGFRVVGYLNAERFAEHARAALK